MPVCVERHNDRRVPEPRLHHLGWQLKPSVNFAVDAPRRVEVPQRVHASVLGLPIRGHYAGGELRRNQCAADEALVLDDPPPPGGEHELVELPPRAGQPPGPQRVDHEGTERDAARAGARLGLADDVETVGALTHANLPALEINVPPRQPAQFAGAQARKGRDDEKGAPALRRGLDDSANFIGSRDIPADFELALVARATVNADAGGN